MIFMVLNQTPTYYVIITFNSSLYLKISNKFLKVKGGRHFTEPYLLQSVKILQCLKPLKGSIGRQGSADRI